MTWTDISNSERDELLRLKQAGTPVADLAADVDMKTRTLDRRLQEWANVKSVVDEVPDAVKQADTLEDWMNVLENMQELSNLADPIRLQAETRNMGDKPIAIMFTSCWHLGSRFTRYPKFRELFDLWLKTDRLYLGIHGDEIDNFNVGFPSAEAVWNQLLPPKYQRRILAKVVNRLAERDKAIYACWSNHGGFDERRLGENLVKPIYLEAGIPFFDGKGVLKLNLGTQQYLLYVAHEFKGVSQWNRNHPQIKALHFEVPNADLIVMGDKHIGAVQEVPHHIPAYDAGLHKAAKAWMVQVGTAKDGPDLYTIRGWSRGQFEWPVFVFLPDEHRAIYVQRVEDLPYYLGL